MTMPSWIFFFALCPLARAAMVLPPPQYQRIAAGTLDLTGAVILGSDQAQARIARQMLTEEAARLSAPFSPDRPENSRRPRIVLQVVSRDGAADALLDEQDRQILAGHPEQGYVLRVDPAGGRVLLAGATGQGVLYAAATLIQLWRAERGRLLLPEVHIRDHPDFRYRASADWLLLGEINRWAYDWGDGRAAFLQRIKRKLDFALRYKINMIFFDGFGWTAERVPGYSRLMRLINQYARERGIKLIFGGYGYYYTQEYLSPERNIGTAYLNRHYYPDGPVYFCMPGDPLPRDGQETALRTQGTCRANEELLKLKTAELEEFVRSVEPGSLYIHHEDHGDFDPTQFAWKLRCEYCRRRWPNDDLKAKDGGAGALAHGYKALLEAVRRVRNRDTGYDASRDCTVILVSPVYRLQEASISDWNNVLDFWENTVSLLPRDENLEICFREIFPQAQSGQAWMDAYRQRMQSRGLPWRSFVFFLGGSQGYVNRYPFTATASMNAQFLGAETIYSFSGSLHQEALQVFNGVFAWNAGARGRQDRKGLKEAREVWEALNANRRMPPEIFGPGGLLEEICRRLYGASAAAAMKSFLTLSEAPPPAGSTPVRVPHFSERIVPLAVLFDILERDSRYWAKPPASGKVRAGRSEHPAVEWHSRLAQLWAAQAQVNRRAETLVDSALRASDLDRGSGEDIEYLKRCLQVGERFARLLTDFHGSRSAASEQLRTSLRQSAGKQLTELDRWLHENFRFDAVCPMGGDQASWLEALRKLRNVLMG